MDVKDMIKAAQQADELDGWSEVGGEWVKIKGSWALVLKPANCGMWVRTLHGVVSARRGGEAQEITLELSTDCTSQDAAEARAKADELMGALAIGACLLRGRVER